MEEKKKSTYLHLPFLPPNHPLAITLLNVEYVDHPPAHSFTYSLAQETQLTHTVDRPPAH
jgi:hypothetical protein